MTNPTFFDILITLIVLPIQLVNFLMTQMPELIFLDLFNLGTSMSM